MKKYINNYYKLFPSKIYKIKNGFSFFIGEIKYMLLIYDQNINNIEILFNISNTLYNKNILVSNIIKTYDNKLYININNINYVLIKLNTVLDDIPSLNEILWFNNLINVTDKKIYSLKLTWENKVDLIEEKIGELNKEYELIRIYTNYYIGLAENAITMLNNVNFNNVKINLQHRRIKNNINYGYLYNPLNFIIDYDIRDLSEYIKYNYFEGTLDMNVIEKYLTSNIFTSDSLKLLYARLLFPTYYFDELINILNNNEKEDQLNKYIEKANMYEELLVDIYYIIKKITNIDAVEWLLDK